MSSIDIIRAIASVTALMVAIIGHEIMHGWVAYKYGDNTAKSNGRLSLNPIKHIDPIGSILVPGLLFMASAPFLFGWAKPVPIDTRIVINNGGYGAAMQVSLAGIAYNILIAIFASIILLSLDQPLKSDDTIYIFVYLLIYYIVIINVVLAIFNLWPIPQFDGAHFLSYLGLKMGTDKIARFYDRYEPYGMIFVLVILMIPQLRNIIFMPVQWLLAVLLS